MLLARAGTGWRRDRRCRGGFRVFGTPAAVVPAAIPIITSDLVDVDGDVEDMLPAVFQTRTLSDKEKEVSQFLADLLVRRALGAVV